MEISLACVYFTFDCSLHVYVDTDCNHTGLYHPDRVISGCEHVREDRQVD